MYLYAVIQMQAFKKNSTKENRGRKKFIFELVSFLKIPKRKSINIMIGLNMNDLIKTV